MRTVLVTAALMGLAGSLSAQDVRVPKADPVDPMTIIIPLSPKSFTIELPVQEVSDITSAAISASLEGLDEVYDLEDLRELGDLEELIELARLGALAHIQGNADLWELSQLSEMGEYTESKWDVDYDDRRYSQDTDTTFAVNGATRFSIEGKGGNIDVTAWDRDEVRIQANHSRRAEVEITRSRRGIYVESNRIVAYQIHVPASMDLEVESYHGGINVRGMEADVAAEAFTGNVTVHGGSGTVSVISVGGRVELTGASGEINAESTGGTVTIRDSEGEITVESAGGSLTLENVHASEIDAESVGGSIRFTGSLSASGSHYFSSHAGSVDLELPSDTDATFEMATVTGGINVDFRNVSRQTHERGSSTVVLGSGRGEVDIESFGGTIRLRERSRR